MSSKSHKYLTMPFQSMPVSEHPPKLPVRILKNVMIPMRDGVRLCSDIYLPKREATYPTILTRLPYGKREWSTSEPVKGKFWARRGYAYVAQDVRGKFKSEGIWEPFVNETNDGYDTIDWITKQSWCDGRIGIAGFSYMGYTSLATAVSGHPNLVCAAPGMTAADIHGVWMYKGGPFCLQTMGGWLIGEEHKRSQNDLLLDYWHLPLISLGAAAGLKDKHYRHYIEHPRRDAFWDRINLSNGLERISIPMLHMGGWYDVFLKGTIETWREATARAGGVARNNQWLLIGPDDHGSTQLKSGRIGNLEIGKSKVDYEVEAMVRFFDYWLKGVDNGYQSTKRVKFFVVGDNVWREEVAWPPDRMKLTSYYLHSGGKANTMDGDGRLSLEPPSSEPSDSYTYDPGNPVRQSVDENLWYLGQFMKDRSQTELRPDVLIYTSAAVLSDLEITGRISLVLHVSSTSDETDFMAKLLDVFPDGYAHMIQEGALRLSSISSVKAGHVRAPGTPLEHEIDLTASSYVVKVGHKIRLEVSSSDFNRYDRNLNISGEFGKGSKHGIAEQTIYHDSEHPSRMILPIVPRA